MVSTDALVDKVAEANRVISELLYQSTFRVRQLHDYFLLNYPNAVKTVATFYNYRPNVPPESPLWVMVWPNMGQWRYDSNMLILQGETVTSTSVKFTLTPVSQRDIYIEPVSLSLDLVTCSFQEAVDKIKDEYCNTFAFDTNLVTYMQQEPLIQPDEPKQLAAVVTVDGKDYVNLSTRDNISTWVIANSSYNDTFTWNALRRKGQISITHQGVAQ